MCADGRSRHEQNDAEHTRYTLQTWHDYSEDQCGVQTSSPVSEVYIASQLLAAPISAGPLARVTRNASTLGS